ncbi:MAG: PAS domain S-box protein, partial [Desulfuromonadaceae bacterium]|nr:PAS domain S-box protein [Desulfuromonadaceae bacterium]
MNDRLFSLCTPCPDGFKFCRQFQARDFRRAPFALYAPSSEAAKEFLGQHLPRLTGVILIQGDHLSSEEAAPLVSQITVSSAMLPYLADFALHQLLQINQRVNSEERQSFLALENERLELNNLRASEEFIRFRASLLQEIDERRAAERHLAENEGLLRLIMSSTVEAIFGINNDGLCTFANESCLKMLGYDHIGEVLGRNMHDLIHHRTPDGLPIPFEECRIINSFTGGAPVIDSDEFFFRRDGSSFPVEYSSFPIRKEDDIVGGVVTWRDITERKRAELELRLFKESVDNSTDAVGMATPEGKHIYQNEAFSKLFGEIGQNPADVFVDKNVAGEMFKTIMSGIQWTGEVGMYAKDKSVLQIHLRAYANKDAKGKIIGLVGIHTDITERKRSEEERLNMERQLLHAQKLESLGVLAGG